jgi:hypothetical protein
MDTSTVDSGFRKRAWVKVGAGVIGFGAILGLLFLIGKIFGYGFVLSPFGMIPFCIPFVYFCMGIIEVVGGRPYRQLAASWMSLRGWQRGVIGTVIIVASLALILLGVAFVFTYLVR